MRSKNELMIAESCWSKFIPLDWCGPLLLCEAEVRRIPSEIGGVYLLQAFSTTHGQYAVLYAGKAVDLLARLSQHCQSLTTSPDIRIARETFRLFFSAAPVLNGALRSRIEAGLILRLRPPFNRQIPKVAPALTSLPPLSLL
ncbi:MAG: hypothetical protein WCB16_05180 [Candidatus Binatus sp.]